MLRGYLIDVPGHGLTTAFYTAALNGLLHEASKMDVSLPKQLQWLNRQIAQSFDEAALIAAIGFELDLELREFRYVGAGITRFWTATATQTGPVLVSGLFLGANHDQTYAVETLPLAVGDLLYFTTDGMSELLDLEPDRPLGRFREMAALLSSLPDLPVCRDDATAVCLQIKSLPQQLDAEKWPKTLTLNGYGDYQRLKRTVAKILAEVIGKEHSMQEVAVNEALANALECRDGQARSQKARIKFDRIGSWLVVRVKTSRIDFAGNALLRRLRSTPEDLFSFGEDAAMVRGIPLMLSMSDKMAYNNDGTELLLAWRLPQSELC